jgi:N-acetylmuramoyl-L-alanine amidase
MSEMGSTVLDNGINTKWIGTVNFNLRKPNFIIIHHTAQDSLQQTIKTFTVTRTQVSSHYVIADDGSVQMLNDYCVHGMPEEAHGVRTQILTHHR